MKMTDGKARCVLACVLFLSALAGRAADNTAAMSFSGTLNAPPACVINNGQQIDVDFGDRVGVGKVDGQNYLQTVNYRIDCEPGESGQTLGLTVVAAASGFDGAAVPTNVPDLAVRLLLAGNAFVLNKRMAIDAAKPPVLQAVPVKRQGSELKPQAFNAQATLLADYQ
ncbi:fimbrial protein [Serratia entomophila]|uniref:fimbrial protein n=1 Tax=Serratia entomophila TaxID=42906 RepID=UPI00217AC8F7|nr:fimbrial protein [Serratia entomophila]CAI1011586.1 putative minor fimbrial subunit StfF [Serratia entomophila]CAI1012173.1 putative minor fimbrial subunit StfF [Serratia entomophila]CAI1730771.1 putative minor fimbrial subunit StfF [Serratia entomophila]CAI1788884.1 putative minor fimbrial subunit StfF [Serratia entomophila]CAI1796144.1 putative minor fimbrial subunit StfF [Serratia entomophila]